MRRKIRAVLLVLLAVVFLFSAGMVIRQQLEYGKIAADSAEAARIAGLQNGAASWQPAPHLPFSTAGQGALPEPLPAGRPSEALPEALREEEEAAVLAGIDLAALQAVNGDVVGWIEIPGTQLSYPLVQGTDNQYYLNHSWSRGYNSGGAVFLDCAAGRELTDFHTRVYAHRMRDGSMFGMLKNYKDIDYLREHPSVYLVDGTAVRRYDIFAAHEADVKGLVYRLDLESEGLEEELIRLCLDSSVIDAGVVPEAGEQILTLSTCTGRGYGSRWVVQGVLRWQYEITPGEDPEERSIP